MTASIPNIEPTSFAAGESLVWRKRLTDYPATAWTLKYYFRGPGDKFDATATPDGSDYLVSLTVGASQAPGDYYWQAWVIDDPNTPTKQILVCEGRSTCRQSFKELTEAFDGRSDAEQALAAVRAVLAKKASKDVLSYTIGHRQLQKYPVAELLALETRLVQLVNQERRAKKLKQGAPFLKNVHTRFLPPQ